MGASALVLDRGPTGAGRAWIERHHDSDEAARRLLALLGLEDAVRPAR